MEQENITLTSDEKLLSAVAYFFGMLGALIVWILQKEKSKFVRFHTVQALVFDFLVEVLGSVFFFYIFGVMFLGAFGSIYATTNSAASPESVSLFALFPVPMPFVIFAFIFPLMFVLMIVRIIPAVFVLGGQDLRYPWLGIG